MLDFTTPTLTLHAGVIDTIYRTILDGRDLNTALQAVVDTVGARSVRLLHSGRGGDLLLGGVGHNTVETAPQRHGHRIDGPVTATGRRLVLEVAFEGDADSGTVLMLESLLSHIDRAVTLAARMESAETERALGSDLLNRLAVGTVLLDEERQVVGTTGMARALISAGDGLCQRGGALHALCGTEDRLLQSAIKAALSHPEKGPAEVLRVHQPSTERALGIVVQPIAKSDRKGGIACSLVIRDGERTCAPAQDMLRELFDLTPAEASLTRILTMGLTLDEAAAELDISRNTGRAHLRAIFSKCGIKRQTELVRLVLTSVAMLGSTTAHRRAA